jgi:hypothetical protein
MRLQWNGSFDVNVCHLWDTSVGDESLTICGDVDSKAIKYKQTINQLHKLKHLQHVSYTNNNQLARKCEDTNNLEYVWNLLAQYRASKASVNYLQNNQL